MSSCYPTLSVSGVTVIIFVLCGTANSKSLEVFLTCNCQLKYAKKTLSVLNLFLLKAQSSKIPHPGYFIVKTINHIKQLKMQLRSTINSGTQSSSTSSSTKQQNQLHSSSSVKLQWPICCSIELLTSDLRCSRKHQCLLHWLLHILNI